MREVKKNESFSSKFASFFCLVALCTGVMWAFESFFRYDDADRLCFAVYQDVDDLKWLPRFSGEDRGTPVSFVVNTKNMEIVVGKTIKDNECYLEMKDPTELKMAFIKGNYFAEKTFDHLFEAWAESQIAIGRFNEYDLDDEEFSLEKRYLTRYKQDTEHLHQDVGGGGEK